VRSSSNGEDLFFCATLLLHKNKSQTNDPLQREVVVHRKALIDVVLNSYSTNLLFICFIHMKTSRVYTIQKFGAGSMHYIELTDADVKRLTVAGNKRVVCRINNKLDLHAAIMKTKEGMYYIMIGSKYLKQMNLSVNNNVTAAIEIDKSELQFNLPEEFAEVMATDSRAKEVFDRLTPGNKRGLIALINMVKSTDKKIDRALLIAEKVKAGTTSPQKLIAIKT